MSNGVYLTRRGFGALSLTLGAMAMMPAFASSQGPFRLGAMPPLTGAGGEYGSNMLAAIELAVEEVNAAEPDGKPLFELHVEDDQTRAEAAVLAAKKLIEVNRVQAIVGIWSATSMLAVLPMTNGADVVTCNFAGASEVHTSDDKDLVFQFTNYNEMLGRVMARVAKQRGFQNAAVLCFNNATMMTLGRAFARTWQDLTGKEAGFVQYEPAQSSYRTEIDSALASQPDLLLIGGYAPDTTIILKEWYQTGAELTFTCPSWSFTDAVAKAMGPEISRSALVLTSVPAQTTEAYERFRSRFVERVGEEPDLFAAASYDEVILIALAIKLAGSNGVIGRELSQMMRKAGGQPGTKVSTYAEGLAAIAKGEEFDYDGASSDLEFDEYGQVYPDVGIFTYPDGVKTLDDVVPAKA